MKLIAPAYYRDFRCIASACRHSCCIGWEIDIDEDSLALYRALPGATGVRLRSAIEESEDGAHFRLGEHERCPMLRPDGLCELICQCGEESLCQICADHPRFRFDYEDATEIGLGLCCEATAELILRQKHKPELIVLEDDGKDMPPLADEKAIRAFRDRMIDRIFASQRSLWDDICAFADIPQRPLHQWYRPLISLERLDEAWTAHLDALNQPEIAPEPQWDMPLRQLAAYFIYRHMPEALMDGDMASKTAFAFLSCRILMQLLAYHPCGATMENLIDLARMYSAEIEYSDENLWAIIDMLRGAL